MRRGCLTRALCSALPQPVAALRSGTWLPRLCNPSLNWQTPHEGIACSACPLPRHALLTSPCLQLHEPCEQMQ